jgi:hypothetical protein
MAGVPLSLPLARPKGGQGGGNGMGGSGVSTASQSQGMEWEQARKQVLFFKSCPPRNRVASQGRGVSIGFGISRTQGFKILRVKTNSLAPRGEGGLPRSPS